MKPQVYLDKLCDNRVDCPAGEDEGTIVTCADTAEPTENGCCSEVVINGNTHCVYSGTIHRNS